MPPNIQKSIMACGRQAEESRKEAQEEKSTCVSKRMTRGSREKEVWGSSSLLLAGSPSAPLTSGCNSSAVPVQPQTGFQCWRPILNHVKIRVPLGT